jgi:thioredoxin reductase
MNDILKNNMCDVAIIGGGPSGLAAAIELRKKGLERVVVLDRETEAGGIPRHCGHPPFGISEYKRVLTGPSYAKRIVATALDAGVDIQLKTSVTSLDRDGKLTLLSPAGHHQLKAKRVLLATGTREMPRSARMISGQRVLGICNTGALQAMVYLKKRIPFKRPIVVGTEVVSFSALYTCKKAGIEPVAMLEEGPGSTVMWPLNYGANLFNVPLFYNTSIADIRGKRRVESVLISDKDGNQQEIACDGVLLTGKFTPESSLARTSHLKINKFTGAPIVDQYGRCSDHTYYAAGNVLFKPVKVAGKCWRAGRSTAQWIAKDLTRNMK